MTWNIDKTIWFHPNYAKLTMFKHYYWGKNFALNQITVIYLVNLLGTTNIHIKLNEISN